MTDFAPAPTEEDNALADLAAEQGYLDSPEALDQEREDMNDRLGLGNYRWGAFNRDCEITFLALEQKVAAAREGESDENRVRIYARLVEFASQLRQLVRDTEHLTAQDLDANGGSLVVEGIGEVVSSTAADKTIWDLDALSSQLVARAVDEPGFTTDEEGNALPPVVFAERVKDRLAECIKFDYGRIGASKAHGVEAKKYRSFEGGRRRTVRLPKAKHE